MDPCDDRKATALAARDNRKRLRAVLGDGPVVLLGREEGGCAFHGPFRQEPAFRFLSGWDEPGAALLLERGRATLFVPRPDRKRLVWHGGGEAVADIRARGLFDAVRPRRQLDAVLRRLAAAGPVHAPREAAAPLRRSAPGIALRAKPLAGALLSLRPDKNPHEIRLVREACRASARAHLLAMASAAAGLRERQVQAVYEKALVDEGLAGPAFPTIAAAGANAAVLHYERNAGILRAGDLLLLDAGGACGGYAADITRTVPVSGRFSPLQRRVYRLVLEAQEEVLRLAAPGASTADLQDRACAVLEAGLREFGVLRGSREEARRLKSLRLFYPHGVSHSVGLEVHDPAPRAPGPARKDMRTVIELKPGRVLTVEPGLYVNAAALADPALRRRHARTVDWRRVAEFLPVGGVRIEDTVLVTDSGVEILTAGAPKSIREVEDLRRT